MVEDGCERGTGSCDKYGDGVFAKAGDWVTRSIPDHRTTSSRIGEGLSGHWEDGDNNVGGEEDIFENMPVGSKILSMGFDDDETVIG